MEKKPKEKPKYNMWQNACWMIRLAWVEREKKVLVLSLLTALGGVGAGVVELFVTPVILGQVETGVPVWTLVRTILLFCGAMLLLAAANAYLSCNTLFGRVQVRTAIIARLNTKASVTSFPNVSDERFRKLSARAGEACGSNSEATEAVWTTLTELLKNLLGFGIYLALLSSLDLWLAAIIAATSVAGFFITRRFSSYEYDHREEIGEQGGRMAYVQRKSGDFNAAKDIRIFGLRPWLSELHRKAEAVYLAYCKKAETQYLLGRIGDLLLTFVRNGAAYAILIARTLAQGLDASTFLLYFSAAGGFAE